jgi:hypothetical protein
MVNIDSEVEPNTLSPDKNVITALNKSHGGHPSQIDRCLVLKAVIVSCGPTLWAGCAFPRFLHSELPLDIGCNWNP